MSLVKEKDKDKTTTSQYYDKWDHIPENAAWLPSRLFFVWARPLFTRASALTKQGKALEHSDLLPLPPQDHGAAVGPDFEQSWDKASAKVERERVAQNLPAQQRLKLSELQGAQGQQTRKLRRALASVIGKPFVIAGFIKVCNTGLQFTFPILLNNILAFIEETQAGKIPEDAPWYDTYRGYWLAAVLFAAMSLKAVTENAYFHRVYRAGYQARVAISVAVYNKALRLANAERQDTTLGELINLMQVDATKIETFVPQIHVLWDGVLQIVGYMTILYTLIGWPCFAGLALMVAAAPVQGQIMKKMFGQNHQMAKYTDKRVKTTNEALQGMQSVKMYTWEASFEREIRNHRHGELKHLQAIAYLRAFSRAYMSALPGLVAVTSFVVYVLAIPDANISASLLFSALVAFDQLRFPLLFYPMALAQLSQAKVSAARLETFLGMKEVGKGDHPTTTIGDGSNNNTTDSSYHRDETAPGGVQIQDATIYWSDPTIPIRKDTGNVADDDDDDTKSIASSKSGKSSKSDVTKTLPEDEDSDELSTPVVYPKPVLSNVNLQVKQGELCAVVGKVASGKSTLCSAVLNETILSKGSIELHGKVAYAAQTAWVLNASLRDNILFGQPYDQEKYDQVIQACQLTYDLELLDYGDLTEIGERGINLSGGQKQRVSMARAAYADADTIIMDDPLSALDPEVGKALFDQCINKLMKGKTRLLVTNQIQFLQYCDNIVALGKNTVLEQGTYQDLTAKEGGEVKRIVADVASKKENVAKDDDKKDDKGSEKDDVAKEEENTKDEKKEDKLMTKEERNIGAVEWQYYRKYIKAGGGYFQASIVYFGFILCAGNQLATNSWVSFWTSDGEYEKYPRYFYLTIYALISAMLGVLTFTRTFLLVRFGINASAELHHNLNMSVLHAPSSFFDTTPIGRILSRFSKDLFAIDNELSQSLDFFLWCSLQVVFSLGSIVFATPWFGITILPLGFLYFKVLNYFRNVSRETKRLESISRSPVYAQFSESLGGLTTIRAYNQNERFMSTFEGKVDENIRAWYCNKVADRWLSVRLEIIGALIAGLAAVFASNVAISGSIAGKESDSNFSSLAGLSLTYAISLTGLLNWCVRTFAQLEAAMNATERVIYYSEDIPQEAPFTSKGLEDRALVVKDPPASDPSAFAIVAKGGKSDGIPSNWPDKGSITLNNLKMRYRPETPLVLKGLSVAISGGERIGVVGRTGSGKSSLLLTLLRLVEPTLEGSTKDSYEAPLSIDGVDTLRIGLKELRSRLGIIPQNPVLFSGSIRSNVDPFDAYTEEQIWAALERCGMKTAVEEMPGMLNATVSEYGENLSAGMRQMLVLGRALLRQCRVLLLDEATSSVDYETDREIQRTIRAAFPGCTVLTIAHRINTIMDSDKILVMKDGLAAEFAPPQELLEDEKSVFADIVRHAQDDH